MSRNRHQQETIRISATLAAVLTLGAMPLISRGGEGIAATQQATSSATTWPTSISVGLNRAAATGKDTLLWFSGSGWNAASDAAEPSLCDPAFLADAGRDYVLVRADFRAGKDERDEVDPEYSVWAEKLRVAKLPALVAIDTAGRPYGSILSPDRHSAGRMLQQLRESKRARDAAFAKANASAGVERARALDAALTHVEAFVELAYQPVMREILALDSSNEAGLKRKYQDRLAQSHIDEVIQREIYPMLDRRQFADVIMRLDRLLKEQSPSIEQSQLLVAFKAQVSYSDGNAKQALAWLDEAINLNPTGDAANRIRKAKDQIAEAVANSAPVMK